ncbi:MAG: hypothetical protein QOI35_3138, partial [Cryptosporangiaceae bacterium]|nr:hypothetical protein [Cryptosporangiaceae bacterium]
MRSRRNRPLASRGITAVIAVAVAGSILPGELATAAPPSIPDKRVPVTGTKTVTLVTGDRVHVTGEHVSIERGPGRSTMQFRRYRSGGDTYVVPLDAAPLAASGLLDRRLFDVTKLIEFGYDDAHRTALPLIVTTQSASAARSLTGAHPGRDLPSIGATAVQTPKTDAAAFWASAHAVHGLAPAIQRIQLDGPVKATLDQSVPQIGAPAAWKAGFTGKGTTVAVLDTGIDTTHPDLAGLVVQSRNFTSTATAGDEAGHGTHVASTIAGSGAASHGRFKGVAPGSRLLNVKVLDDSGQSTDSTVIAGMEWATAQGARIVNMSLGGEFAGDPTDALSTAVNRLTAQTGALFVIAAGNAGAARAIG